MIVSYLSDYGNPVSHYPHFSTLELPHKIPGEEIIRSALRTTPGGGTSSRIVS